MESLINVQKVYGIKDTCIQQFVHKPSSLIQCWVETGYLPYRKLQTYIGESKQSSNHSSIISQEILNLTNKNTTNRTDNFVLQSNNKTRGRRKKLYTGRDSPVDLVNIVNNSEGIVSKLKRNIHPALGFGCNLSKKRKRKKSNLNINQYSRKINVSAKDILSINNNIINNSIINKHLVKCNTGQYLNTSLPVKFKSINKQNEFIIPTNDLEKTDTQKCKKSNNITEQSKDLNPVIRLTRLSKCDIEKYMKSKKITKNNELNVTELPKIDDKKHRNLNQLKIKTNLNPIVCLTRLSITRIQKNKKPKKIINLTPMVLLKRLSEFEIQKYKRFSSSSIHINNNKDNSVVLLSSDEDNQFEKFVPCSKKIHKPKLRHHKMLYQDCNEPIKKLRNGRFNIANNSMKTEKTVMKSTDKYKLISESVTVDPKLENFKENFNSKNQNFSGRCNLLAQRNYKQVLREKQPIIKNQTKSLLGAYVTRNKSNPISVIY